MDYILVHFDVDVINPGEYPLGNVPNWTGVGFDEIMTALKLFLKSPKAVGLIIAEVNPDHDPGLRMTGRLVHEIDCSGIFRAHENVDILNYYLTVGWYCLLLCGDSRFVW